VPLVVVLKRRFKMRNFSTACLLGSALLMLGACKSLTVYEPIIDSQGVDMSAYEEDLQQCRDYGDQVQVGQTAAQGAARGAVVGGVIGAIFGNGNMAARTAGAGGVGGGASGASRGYGERREVIRNCLIGRGYRVLN
jgi:outer membrane lipoprotein SlyB